jgi:hypothetical protein
VDAGLGQREIHRMTGVARETIRRAERGQEDPSRDVSESTRSQKGAIKQPNRRKSPGSGAGRSAPGGPKNGT